MEPAIGALQFVWIAGHRRRFASHDDYFVELVEHLTAITPDIDRRVARVLRRARQKSIAPTAPVVHDKPRSA